ncbi:hypothetical protein FRC01_006897 [Tulasnella sp. 417]|nr:hypothetical protein FRC01_006897 [Tulasnella sp. 417]
MDAIHKLGYSMIIARPERLYELYRLYHKNVHLVIWDSEAHPDCMYNPACVYAEFGENGSLETTPVPPPNATHLNIPIWKLFHPNWWNYPVEPLRGPFTLSPEPYEFWPAGSNSAKENFYLGYTVEPSCMETPYVPHAERPLQAYIFGKDLRYFMHKDYILWGEERGMEGSMQDDFYLDFSQKENVTFLAGRFNFEGALGNYTETPRGITHHEKLPRTEFQKVVAESRVLIGLGHPMLSPTPYEALCLGIPFINPVRRGDKNDLTNKMAWTGQHDALIYEGLDEPYVYHVELGDREGLRAALRKAMTTPIERYIPPHMTSSAFLRRMKSLLETDWRPVAKMQMQVVNYKYQT